MKNLIWNHWYEKGNATSRSHTRARILFMSVAGYLDKDIAKALNVSSSMIFRHAKGALKKVWE